jgi:hypothetical protein
VVNDGNGWDNLTFGLARYEVEGQQNWTIDLFENRAGDGQVSGSPSVNGAGSPIPPGGEHALLGAHAPPKQLDSDRRRVVATAATATGAAQAQVLGEFIAGVVRSASVPTRAGSYSSHTNFVPATLYQGRLFWMGTVTHPTTPIIFRTRDSVEETQGSAWATSELRMGERCVTSVLWALALCWATAGSQGWTIG